MDIISYSKAKKAEQLAQSVIDGEFDLGVARTAIDTKLTALETQYEPQLNDTKTRVSKIESNLSEQESQTQTLTHGLNVINSDQPSPLKVEIYGNTLPNLLGKIGNFETDSDGDGLADGWAHNSAGTKSLQTTNAKYGTKVQRIAGATNDGVAERWIMTTATVKSGKYYIVISDIVTDGVGTGRLGVQVGGVWDYTTTSNQNKIHYKKFSPSTDQDISIAIYNMSPLGSTNYIDVDGVRVYEVSQSDYNKIGVSLTDADVERMFPYVDSVQHVKNPVVKVSGENLAPTNPSEWEQGMIDSSTGSNANSTTNIRTSGYYDITGNSQVTTSQADGTLYIALYDENKSFISLNNGTFTTPNNARYMRFRISDTTDITPTDVTTIKPMFNLGSTALPFTEKNDSYLYAETVLAGNDNKKDILSYNEDKRRWEKTKWWETDVVLGGSDNWAFYSSVTGAKVVNLPLKNGSNPIVAKNDGTPLEIRDTSVSTTWDKGDLTRITGGNLFISISNTDSGWAEDYTPTSQDIKDFFTNKNYFLSYQLAKPVIEVEGIDFPYVEGDLAISGDAQVEVGSGVVVREKVEPKYANILSTDLYVINYQGGYTEGRNKVDNRLRRFVSVYKNGVIDTDWSLVNNPNISFGDYYASIPQSKFDPTAHYSVTYEILDKHAFTTNLNEVKATYQQSMKSSFSRVVEKQSDMATDLSINKRSIIDLYVRMKALESGV